MKLTLSTCARLVGSLFALYLLIHYWPSVSGAAILLLGAASSLILGALLAMVPAMQRRTKDSTDALLRLSLFTSLLNIAAAIA